jgi:hypothetical protein
METLKWLDYAAFIILCAKVFFNFMNTPLISPFKRAVLGIYDRLFLLLSHQMCASIFCDRRGPRVLYLRRIIWWSVTIVRFTSSGTGDCPYEDVERLARPVLPIVFKTRVPSNVR